MKTIVYMIKKAYKIGEELLTAFKILNNIGPTVTIFGSARTSPKNKYYKKAFHLGYKLANAGFNVITGGGPGIMEAANKGAYFSGNAASIGLSIELKLEKKFNDYLNKRMVFDYFFTRKYMMTQAAFAYVVFPGGVGTLDEFFEVITLIQTGKAKPGKVFLVGRDFYKPIVHYMKNVMLPAGMISPEDLDLFELVEDTNHIVDQILRAHKEANNA